MKRSEMRERPCMGAPPLPDFASLHPGYLAAVAMPGCGLLALWLGQDASFDQLNYHLYGPWALLHGRILFDVFPAFIGPTFHNPTADVPFYLLAVHAPPRVVGFLLGAVHGLVAAPLYLIACALVPNNNIVALLLVLAGMTGAMSIAETGTTFGDDLTAILVLGGLAAAVVMLPQLACACPGEVDPVRRSRTCANRESCPGEATGKRCSARLRRAALLAFVAAVPVGVAAGLKLTAAIDAGAFALTFLAVRRAWPERGALVAAAAAGAGIGFVVAGGPWFFILWQHTGNPTFPYLNQIFHSPLALPISHRDDSFVPEGVLDTVLFPFLVALGRLSDAEFPFRDLRVPVLYGLVLLVGLARLSGRASGLSPAARLVLAFAAACYVPWLATFAIARYLLPVELLAPALIVALIGALVPAVRPRAAVAALALGLVVVTTRPADWGRIAWGDELYGVRVPPVDSDGLVVIAGTAPTAFLIPFFPPTIPFIRADGFYTDRLSLDYGLYRTGADRIRRHSGALYLLHRGDEEASAREVATRFGLIPTAEGCRAVENRLEPADGPHGGILLCRVGRRD
jgi:hypothetical protein